MLHLHAPHTRRRAAAIVTRVYPWVNFTSLVASEAHLASSRMPANSETRRTVSATVVARWSIVGVVVP